MARLCHRESSLTSPLKWHLWYSLTCKKILLTHWGVIETVTWAAGYEIGMFLANEAVVKWSTLAQMFGRSQNLRLLDTDTNESSSPQENVWNIYWNLTLASAPFVPRCTLNDTFPFPYILLCVSSRQAIQLSDFGSWMLHFPSSLWANPDSSVGSYYCTFLIVFCKSLCFICSRRSTMSRG